MGFLKVRLESRQRRIFMDGSKTTTNQRGQVHKPSASESKEDATTVFFYIFFSMIIVNNNEGIGTGAKPNRSHFLCPVI